MGWGDELIASGLARGAAHRGKRIAFGDGKRIIWSAQSFEIFRLNQNIAWPGEEMVEASRLFPSKLEWIPHYRGRRLYGYVENNRWRFVDFECKPGEVVFDDQELAFAATLPWGPFVVVEPRVKPRGACHGANKQWPLRRYAALVEALERETGIRTVQLVPPAVRPALANCGAIETPSFRHALAALRGAALYIGPEGGLHHGAAAVSVPAVVIFGGFNTPRSTGYPWHENLTAAGEPCGTIAECAHCREAMAAIDVDQVLAAALRQLGKRVAA
jgi:ADP-heptose:LPS heptosyltransferase